MNETEEFLAKYPDWIEASPNIHRSRCGQWEIVFLEDVNHYEIRRIAKHYQFVNVFEDIDEAKGYVDLVNDQEQWDKRRGRHAPETELQCQKCGKQWTPNGYGYLICPDGCKLEVSV